MQPGSFQAESPSLYTHITEGECNSTTKLVLYHLVSAEDYDLSLSSLFPQKAQSDFCCLSQLAYSPWNPPPHNRRLHGMSDSRTISCSSGDIFYIEVITLEEDILTITCWRNGFFVNGSTRTSFNPSPHPDHEFRSHSLAVVLSHVSPLFKRNFQKMVVRY